MAYTALYRKFRPQTFSGVIGQEHIVRTELLDNMQLFFLSRIWLSP